MLPESPVRRRSVNLPPSADERLRIGIDDWVPLVTSTLAIGSRDWRITSVQNQDLLLDASEELEHFPFGFLLWESAVGLARYLTANPDLVNGRRVLELGAGVGVAGIAAQALGAKVWQTDHQKGSLQLAHRNAVQNDVAGIEQFLADWRNWSHTACYDVVLGADITYERDMHFYLEQIFRSNLASGGTILLSDPGRPQSLEFMALLEKKGWKISLETRPVSRIETSEPCESVEVAILKLSRG